MWPITEQHPSSEPIRVKLHHQRQSPGLSLSEIILSTNIEIWKQNRNKVLFPNFPILYTRTFLGSFRSSENANLYSVFVRSFVCLLQACLNLQLSGSDRPSLSSMSIFHYFTAGQTEPKILCIVSGYKYIIEF